MRQKWTIFALAALLTIGMTGCGSGSNRTVDESRPSTYAVQPDGETGNYDGGSNGGNGTIGGNGANRDEVLKVLSDESLSGPQKKAAVRALDGGATWQQLIATQMTKLRKVVVSVE